jgi:hypothetical protein
MTHRDAAPELSLANVSRFTERWVSLTLPVACGVRRSAVLEVFAMQSTQQHVSFTRMRWLNNEQFSIRDPPSGNFVW